MPRPERESMNEHNSGQNICQYQFSFNEVVPCHLEPDVEQKRLRRSAMKWLALSKRNGNSQLDIHSTRVPPAGKGTRTPCYELNHDGSGKPYSSILKMRSDKIRNHFSVKEYDW